MLLIYGIGVYLMFLATVAYAVAWVGDFLVPRTVDSGPHMDTGRALVIDLSLLLLFAVQHSGMARGGFKRWWTRLVAPSVERSTYVLATNLVLWLMFWQWRPIPTIVWDVHNSAGRFALWALYGLGWATAVSTTFLINHFDLFGLRQVWLRWRGRLQSPIGFRTPLLYRLVRHPLMLGFIVAFWATPRMTAGHLLFSVATTGYILVALRLEERDLLRAYGPQYERYRRAVPMLIPIRRGARAGEGVGEGKAGPAAIDQPQIRGTTGGG
jgi:methanethiol S-methyltransferase